MFKKSLAKILSTPANTYLLIIISILYFLYAFLILKPYKYKYFSLIDDGQVLIQSTGFVDDCIFRQDCENFVSQTFELGAGRFRPSYWLINNFIYKTLGNNAPLHHQFRIYFLGYLAVLLLYLVLKDLKLNNIGIFIGIMVFMFSFSFSENFIRLGTNEPFQIIFLAIFSLLYLNQKSILKVTNIKKRNYLILLITFLTLTLLLKESTIAIAPVILIIQFLRKETSVNDILLVLVPPLVLFGGIWLSSRSMSVLMREIPNYETNYVISLSEIYENANKVFTSIANSTAPFFKFLIYFGPLGILLTLFRKKKINFIKVNYKFVYWLLFFVFFTFTLFFWRYSLERYQLMSIFSLSVLIAILVSEANLLFRNILNSKAILFFVRSLLLFLFVYLLSIKSLPLNIIKTINYSNRFATLTKFEHDQVKSISDNITNNDIYINGVDVIENWEVLYEIPIHLKYFYGVSTEITLLGNDLSEEGVVFSRSSFESSLDIYEGVLTDLELIAMHKYSVIQYDPLLFRQLLKKFPTKTLIKPPVKESIEYYWELRKI